MQAVQLHDKMDIRLNEVPDVEHVPHGWLRLKVEACGICGTDIEEFENGPSVVPTAPHPLTGRCAPLTLGHEVVGVVDGVGTGASFAIGERVGVDGNIGCSQCWYCLQGQRHLCGQWATVGLMLDGGLADYVLVPAYSCASLSESVPAAQATLVEPLAVALKTIRSAGVHHDSDVAVFGAGPVGLLTALMARRAGAATVSVIDPIAARRDLATTYGADFVFHPDEAATELPGVGKKLGCDIAIEASGNPRAVQAAVDGIRKGGTVVVIGLHRHPITLDMPGFVLEEKQIRGSVAHDPVLDFQPAAEMINSGEIPLAPLISQQVPLYDIISVGFADMVTKPSDQMRVVAVSDLRQRAG